MKRILAMFILITLGFNGLAMGSEMMELISDGNFEKVSAHFNEMSEDAARLEINTKDETNQLTLLSIAILSGNEDLYEYLVDKGGDVSIMNGMFFQPIYPLKSVVENKQNGFAKKIIKELVDKGHLNSEQVIDSLKQALRDGNMEIVMDIMERDGLIIDERDLAPFLIQEAMKYAHATDDYRVLDYLIKKKNLPVDAYLFGQEEYDGIVDEMSLEEKEELFSWEENKTMFKDIRAIMHPYDLAMVLDDLKLQSYMIDNGATPRPDLKAKSKLALLCMNRYANENSQILENARIDQLPVQVTKLIAIEAMKDLKE